MLLANLVLLQACQLAADPAAKAAPTSMSSADSLRNNQRESKALQQVAIALDSLKTGDLIVRRGNDFTSETLRQLNRRNTDYSHCGIVSIENDTAWVYHALGGDFNPDQKLLRESVWLFCHPAGNKGFGLYRFDLPTPDLTKVVQSAQAKFQHGITFDMDFQLDTDEKQYCAEFVYKCYQLAPNLAPAFSLSRLGDKIFIGVDDLFLHPLCRPITAGAYP